MEVSLAFLLIRKSSTGISVKKN